MTKIGVVGAGPAGSYCSYYLASNGLRPIVFDHTHPREKPCGGYISTFAQEMFPFLKRLPMPCRFHKEIQLVSPLGRHVVVFGVGNSIGVSRLKLDQHILNMAVEEGAKLVKEKVVAVKSKEDRWIIKTEKGLYTCEILVGADGVNSLVRKKLVGPISPENLSICFGYFVQGLEEQPILFKFLANRKGYTWVIPRWNYTSIGIGAELKHSQGLRRELNIFIQQYYPQARKIVGWTALIPSIKNPKVFDVRVAGSNWVLVGDAAGHVDSVTGEGILYALWSGKLAAKAIIESNPRKFDELWREEYENELMTSCRLRSLIYNRFMLEMFVTYLKLQDVTIGSLVRHIQNRH